MIASMLKSMLKLPEKHAQIICTTIFMSSEKKILCLISLKKWYTGKQNILTILQLN